MDAMTGEDIAIPRPVRTVRPAERWARRLWLVAGGVGALVGLAVFWFHIRLDPLVDVHAYYDAGARLNAGLPLYPTDADVNAAEFYRYPPLLAIIFRPIAALMPFEPAALLWGAFCFLTFFLTLKILGVRRFEVWVVAGLVGIGIGWSLAIGQAQVPVTWLLAIGSPWAVAFATNLKVLPLLVAVFWVGRRDWRALGVFAAWMAGLFLFQLVLEPAGTIAFLQITNLQQVGEVNNLSPYAFSPALWAVLVVAGGLLCLYLARTPAGWAAAVAFSVLATPRLLSYMFITLLACTRRVAPSKPPVPEAAVPSGPTDRPEAGSEGC